MNSRSVQRSAMLIVALAIAVVFASCVPVPLGDPEKAKIDRKLVGAWQWKDGDVTNVAVFRAYDPRTYLVDMMAYGGTLAQPTIKNRALYKAWLSELKGQTFINMQPIQFLEILPGEDSQKFFLVGTIKIGDKELTAKFLDGEYPKFKEATTTSALERIVGENMNDVAMWAKSPITARKLEAAHMGDLTKLSKAFENLEK